MKKQLVLLISMLVGVVAIAGCTSASASTGDTATYTPVTRNITVTGVPLLVHEQQGIMDFLNTAFADGGVLQDKEVYAWAPDSITVYAGDTVNLTLINPADDAHTFDIPDLGVNQALPGQSTAQVSFTADKAGIYEYLCQVGEHLPFMTGQLIVLPAP